MHMDTRGGLQEHITIQWRTYSGKQLLDYEGVTYRFCRCHKVRHVFRDCPLNIKGGQRSHENVMSSTIPQEPSQHVKEVEEQPQQALSEEEREHEQGPKKKWGKAPLRPPSPPLTRARTALRDAFTVSMENPPLSFAFAASNFHFSFNSHTHDRVPPTLPIPFGRSPSTSYAPLHLLPPFTPHLSLPSPRPLHSCTPLIPTALISDTLLAQSFNHRASTQ